MSLGLSKGLVVITGVALLANSIAYADPRIHDPRAWGAVAAAEPTCDNICEIIVNPNTAKTKGIMGDDGWSNFDDEWCANHAVSTNPTVLPKPQAKPSGNPINCNVPLLMGDSSCQETNTRLSRCKLKGSQIESKCMAYYASKKASTHEKVTLGFDITATAVCGTACAGQFFGVGAALVFACNAAGIAATVNELIQTIKAKNSGVGRYIAAGSAMGVGGLVTGIGAVTALKAPGKLIGKDATKFLTADGKKLTPAGEKAKKNACIAAASFGALTGIRAMSMKGQVDTKKSHCDGVKELAGQSLATGFGPLSNGGGQTIDSGGTITTQNSSGASENAGSPGGGTEDSVGTENSGDGSGAGPGGTDGSSTSNGSTNSTSSTGSTNSSSSGSRGSSSIAGSSNSTSLTDRGPNGLLSSGGGFEDYKKCLMDPSCTNATLNGSPNGAAVDGGLLTSSGLATELAPKVAEMGLDKIVSDIANGRGVGGAIDSAMGGGSNAAALGSLANEAQANGANLGIGNLAETVPTSGGAPATAGGGEAEDPFKLLAQGETAANPSGAAFGNNYDLQGAVSCADGDIWHARCRGTPTIFQIVSEKINRSRDRVEQLGWSIPMNRAMASQPEGE